MTPDDLARVQSAHTAALQVPPPDRAALLNELFPREPALRQEVLDLLRYSDAADGFLRTPFIDRFLPADDGDLRPRRAGPYELIRELGHGGEASVYLGRRADDLFEKQVAVKILNRLSLGRDSFRRFQSEIQILASLDNPYIVHLLDAGTTSDAVAYIVTEFVDGQHIDAFCKGLSLPAILQLLLKVCEGVSASHQRLIVHRDLKPSNILVTPAGIPKLVDFGIAIPLNRPERLTRTGFDRMTERYASPEQLSGSREVSTLTDMYSLGAVFRELIPKPPRDLAAILAKASSIEPRERYRSVEQLREDLERFLVGQPVVARGQSVPYRVLSFCRRHWLAVPAVGFGLIALAGLSVFSTVEALQAKRKSQQVKALLLKGFSEATPDGWAGLRQLHAVETARLSYLDPIPDDLQNDLDLQTQRFLSWRTLGSVQGLPSSLNLGNTAQALQNLQKAAAIGESILHRFPHSQEVRDVALTHVELGSVMLEMGRRADAEAQFSRAGALIASEPNDLPYRVRLEVAAQRSRILVLRGQPEAALALRRDVVRFRRELFLKDARSMAWEYAGGLCSYGELLRQMGRSNESANAYAEALPIIEQSASEAPMGLEMRWHLARENEEFATALLESGRLSPAMAHLNRAVQLYRDIRSREPDAMSNQRALAVCLAKLSAAAARQGDRREALSLVNESLALSTEAVRRDPASERARSEFQQIFAQQASFMQGTHRSN
jgi:tetratricopeptide (TPR) repeat protein/tRNA A-37 threonylcarbamoyl transferase component Bud32